MSHLINFDLTERLVQTELAILVGLGRHQGGVSRSLKMGKGPMFQLLTMIQTLQATLPPDAFKDALEKWLAQMPDGEERAALLNETLKAKRSRKGR